MAERTAPRWRPGEALDGLRRTLARGGLLAIPTESSYGLAVDPRNPAGVDAVYAVKARERGKPLPVVVADLDQLALLGIRADRPEVALGAAFWPAPLTVIVPVDRPLPAAAGTGSLAVRVPAHDGLRALLRELGPLTATSANLAGEPPLLGPDEVADLLRDADAVVVDGGLLPGGPPSTLVELVAGEPRVVRAGAFPAGRLRAAAVGPSSGSSGGRST